MTKIEIKVQGANAYANLHDGPLTAGMVGAEAAFSFDAAWDGLNITAKFRGGSTVKSRALVGTNQTTVPHEVLSRCGVVLEIGVEGRRADGSLVIPTVWAKVDMIHPGANDAAEEGREPTPTVYDDIMAAIKAGKLKGDKGDIGPRGAQGLQGASGKSAYEFAVAGGYDGTEEEFYAAMAKAVDTQKAVDEKVSFNKQTLTKDQQAQTMKNIGAMAEQHIKDYVYPLEFTDGKVRHLNGTDTANGVYRYATAKVSAGAEITIAGWQPASALGFYAYYFYDKDGACIEHSQSTASGVAVNVTVIVPENAVELVVNGKPESLGAFVRGDYNRLLAPQDIWGEVVKLDKKIDNCRSQEATIVNYEYPLEITEGKAWNVNGWALSGAAYSYATCSVTAGDTIEIVGYQASAAQGYHLYYFYNENGEVIDKYNSTATGVVVTATVVVPENAVKLIVNGRPERAAIKVVGERTGKYGLDYVLGEINKMNNGGDAETKPKLMTLGDSITALGTGERGWVGYFIEKTGCELVANAAVIGATLHDKVGTVYDGNPVFNGDDNNVNNVLGNQVEKIIRNSYEAPDIIMIAVGTNGASDNPKVNPWDGGVRITKDDMSAVYYNEDKSLIPLENVDRKKDAGAYRYALEKLHNLYPNAIIFWCTPIHAYQGTRTAEEISANAESLRIATDYTGQILIDTHRCGINGVNELNNANGEYLIDGLHPNINGAKKIGYYNASKVMPFLGNNFVKV